MVSQNGYEGAPQRCHLDSWTRFVPIPLAVRAKAWVWGSWLAGVAGSNPAGGTDGCLLWILCCQAEVSVTGRSLAQTGPTECVCVTEWSGATITSKPKMSRQKRSDYERRTGFADSGCRNIKYLCKSCAGKVHCRCILLQVVFSVKRVRIITDVIITCWTPFVARVCQQQCIHTIKFSAAQSLGSSELSSASPKGISKRVIFQTV